MSSNASTAMQSLLALVGAISLQSGARRDAQQVEEGMRNRMETILGDGFDKRLKDQQESEATMNKKDGRLNRQQTTEGKVTKVRQIDI